MPSRRAGLRRGQSLVLAIAVMFLMIFLGALFVTMIARNLNRVERTGGVAEAQQLAEAGLRYADSQLSFSNEGADWRPQLDPNWNLPFSANNPNSVPEATRRLHPDYQWLTDGGTYRNPFVSFTTGEGRFLLRVTYEPTFRGGGTTQAPEEFDPLTGYIRIEVIGRPGQLDPNDPTQLVGLGNNPNWEPGQILGVYRRIEGYKPIGLTDQLWWVTNNSKSRGPAQFGVAPYQDGNGKAVRYVSEFRGGVRSNVDLTYVGDTRFMIRPNFGEGVFVAGEMRHQRSGNIVPQVGVQLLDNLGNPLGQPIPEGESGSQLFNPLVQVATGRGHYLDALALSNDSTAISARSIRTLEAPKLDVEDPGGVLRYRRLTRDSGQVTRLTNPQTQDTKDENLGVYGYGAGLYVDNFEDIQYPNDRDTVVNEWLQRGPGDVVLTGWVGPFYTPSVRQQSGARPILEAVLTENDAGDPVIRMTRTDPDTENRNFGTTNRRGTRLFYRYTPPGTMQELGTTAEFPYPENGVLYTEGSVRVRGIVGLPGKPKALTVVSGGSIYIEGNLLKGDPTSRLALLARDYVALNPTKFTTVTPGDDVHIEGDQTGPDVKTYHYTVPQNSYIDIQTASMAPMPNGMLLHLQHSGGYEDANSRTDLAMYINGLDPANRYDFAAFPPPFPSTGGSASNNTYQFFFFPPSVNPPWFQSNAQSILGSTVNYERKSFFIPAARINSAANSINTFRIHVEPTSGGQPYWLSRVMATPLEQPLEARVEALIYAQNGSWFVIPGPWFNESASDSRDLFAQGDTSTGRPARVRGPGTFPADTEHYPFYREPQNIKVLVRGAISENLPAAAVERVQWVKKLWLDKTAYNTQGYSVPAWYDPSIQYEYDDDFRRWVRYRNVVTGAEGLAYVGPGTPPGNTNPTRLAAVRQAAMAAGQNIVTLPLFPRLPTGGLIYHGNPS